MILNSITCQYTSKSQFSMCFSTEPYPVNLAGTICAYVDQLL